MGFNRLFCLFDSRPDQTELIGPEEHDILIGSVLNQKFLVGDESPQAVNFADNLTRGVGNVNPTVCQPLRQYQELTHLVGMAVEPVRDQVGPIRVEDSCWSYCFNHFCSLASYRLACGGKRHAAPYPWRH